MGSDVVVISGVGFQDPTQMHLAQDNDVVHTFTPDRSDQPFDKAILPGRGWCGRLVLDAHGAQSARDDGSVDPISVSDEVAALARLAEAGSRCLVPANSFAEYAPEPNPETKKKDVV